MLESGSRTTNSSVVFADIVGYAKSAVAEQIAAKERFHAALTSALAETAVDERIVLDTGDGAAISFLGSPGDALLAAMILRDSARAATESGAGFALRVGVNLGPIKLTRDAQGHPSVVGDGINVAQRIMGFASPHQVVVSRSFYDAVADDNPELFKYEGSRTDRHVREHEIYVVGETSRAGRRESPRATDSEVLDEPITEQRKRLLVIGALLALLVFGLAIAVLIQPRKDALRDGVAGAVSTNSSTERPAIPPSVAAEYPTTAPASDTAPSGTPGSPESPAVTPAATPSAPAGTKPTPASETTASGGATSMPPSAATTGNTSAAPAPLPTGLVSFQIQPWGEVFVNGKSIGVSPPLKQTRLPVGKHKIEIKNLTLAPLTQTIEVSAKDTTIVKHRFQ